jgi:TM2 domain-containing membrane protein YozV
MAKEKVTETSDQDASPTPVELPVEPPVEPKPAPEPAPVPEPAPEPAQSQTPYADQGQAPYAAQSQPYYGTQPNSQYVPQQEYPYAQQTQQGYQYAPQPGPQYQQAPPQSQQSYGYQQSQQSYGYQQPPQQTYGYQQPYVNPADVKTTDKDRIVAGLLGIFLGSLGIHKFYLGYRNEGLIMLLISIVGGCVTFTLASWVMWVIGLIEGIMYLTKSQREFEQTYVYNRKGWF